MKLVRIRYVDNFTRNLSPFNCYFSKKHFCVVSLFLIQWFINPIQFILYQTVYILIQTSIIFQNISRRLNLNPRNAIGWNKMDLEMSVNFAISGQGRLRAFWQDGICANIFTPPCTPFFETCNKKLDKRIFFFSFCIRVLQ